jgi:hypothetical protein
MNKEDPMRKKDEGLELLNQTRRAFAEWRKHKRKWERVPEELWEKVVELLPFYSQYKIVGHLRLSQETFKKKMKIHAVKKEKSDVTGLRSVTRSDCLKHEAGKGQSIEFVATSVGNLFASKGQDELASTESGWKLSVQSRDGTRLHIQPPSFDDQRLVTLMNAFLGR